MFDFFCLFPFLFFLSISLFYFLLFFSSYDFFFCLSFSSLPSTSLFLHLTLVFILHFLHSGLLFASFLSLISHLLSIFVLEVNNRHLYSSCFIFFFKKKFALVRYSSLVFFFLTLFPSFLYSVLFSSFVYLRLLAVFVLPFGSSLFRM